MLFLAHCSENLTWQMGKKAGKYILYHFKHNAYRCYYLCMKLQCTSFYTLKLSVNGIYNYSMKCKLELKFQESITLQHEKEPRVSKSIQE